VFPLQTQMWPWEWVEV